MEAIIRRFFASLLCVAVVLPLIPTTYVYAYSSVSSVSTESGAGISGDSLHVIKSVKENSDGYDLTIEAYAEGSKWDQETGSQPLDVVLLLDVSESMNETQGDAEYEALPSAAYTFNSFVNGVYYYLSGTDYYPMRKDSVKINAGLSAYAMEYKPQQITFSYNGSTVSSSASYLAENPDATLFEGVLYRKKNDKISYMRNAVSDLVDNLASDANTNGVTHSVSVVKFGSDSVCSSVGNTFGFDPSSRTSWNYIQTVISPIAVSTNKSVIKSMVNSLKACGNGFTNLGLEQVKSVLFDGLKDSESKKVVIVITDGVPYENTSSPENLLQAANIASEIKNVADIYVFGLGSDSGLSDFANDIASSSKALLMDDYSTLSSSLVAAVKNEYEITGEDDLESKLEDEVGTYFKYDTTSYSVYRSQRKSGSGWNTEEDITEDVTVDFSGDNSVTVSGFDFAANSCYKNNKTWQGYKLVVKLKLLSNETAVPEDTTSIEIGENTSLETRGYTLNLSESPSVKPHKISYVWAGEYPEELAVIEDDNLYLCGQQYTVKSVVDQVITETDAYGNVCGRYVFQGWDKQDGKVSNSDITITGTWVHEDIERSTYQVKYSWSGDVPSGLSSSESVNTPTDINIYYNNMPYTVDGKYTAGMEITVSKNKYEKTIYTFSGWKLDGKNITGGTINGSDVELEGVWSKVEENTPHTIVTYFWNADKAPAVAVLPEGGDYENNYEYEIDTNYYKDYRFELTDKYKNVTGIYTFSGWKINGTAVSGKQNTGTAEKIEIKGEWSYETVTPTNYSIKYQWDGTVYPKDKQTPTDTTKYVKGQPYTVDTTYKKNTTVKEYDTDSNIKGTYKFSGWSMSDGVITDTDIVIKGSWTYETAKYTIVFKSGDYGKLNGNTKSITSQYEYGTSFPSEPSVTPDTGYVFYAWADIYGQLYFTLPDKVTDDLVLTAQWKKTGSSFDHQVAYQVEYYLENSKGKYELKKTVFPLYATESTKVTADVLTFDGYALNEKLSTKSGTTYLKAAQKAGEDPDILVLKLYYDIGKYTIKFEVNTNGTLNGGKSDITYSLAHGDKFPTVPTAKANTGYEFTGWVDKDGKSVTTFPSTVTASATYKAIWETEKNNPNTGAEGTYVIGIMAAAAMLAFITGKRKR